MTLFNLKNKSAFVLVLLSCAISAFVTAAENAATSDALLPKLDAGGKPVLQMRITVYRADETNQGVIAKTPEFSPYEKVKGVLLRDGAPVSDLQTDSNGQFTVEGLEEGFYDFVAESQEFGHFGNEEIMIKYDANGIEEMKFQLSENGLSRLPNDLSELQSVKQVSSEAALQEEGAAEEPAPLESVPSQTTPSTAVNTANTIPNIPNTPWTSEAAYGYNSAYGSMGAASGMGAAGGMGGLAMSMAGLATALGVSLGTSNPVPVSPATP